MPFRSMWLLVGPALAIVGFAAGEPIITGVGIIVIVIGGGSRFWASHLFDRVTLTTSVSDDHVFQNEVFTLTVELENPKILPLPWFEWRIAVADAMKADGERLASSSSRRGGVGSGGVAPPVGTSVSSGRSRFARRNAVTITSDQRP